MDYTQLTSNDVQRMLQTIGISSVDNLFSGIDARHRVPSGLKIPAGLSEPEMLADLQRLASRNKSTDQQISFLGAGIYDHFIPTLVDALAHQSEFVTAYTPYQAEASQGTLQAFYEFQTMVCQLFGMDVSNASLYEMTSAAAEAMLMARDINGRRKVLISGAAHPDLLAVLRTYASNNAETQIAVLPITDGITSLTALRSQIDPETCAVVMQHPNFFGNLEAQPQIADIVHQSGALLITAVDPISCGLLKPPGDYGTDIAVAEGQALGIPQQFGGPALGLLATRNEYMRKIPGRLVGMTVDKEGRRAFCLTLQAREQHIRREKASSNVCTNQGLMAMRATVYMATMGRQGLRQVAQQCFDKAHYAARQIAQLPGYELAFPKQSFFKEFVIRTRHDVKKLLHHAQAHGVLAGVPLDCWFAEMNDCFMMTVTEKRTRAEIDRLVEILRNVQ
ncbi:MAG: putative glycine dehydrogenase (decarboxylating) subunit 1 [Phycisphaerae bacterium]|nr:putative glycine dehydrogenase (decarboxylating) subunit 1 [Phycisphaerae bacterium]